MEMAQNDLGCVINCIEDYPNNSLPNFWSLRAMRFFTANGYDNSWMGQVKNGRFLPKGTYFLLLDLRRWNGSAKVGIPNHKIKLLWIIELTGNKGIEILIALQLAVISVTGAFSEAEGTSYTPIYVQYWEFLTLHTWVAVETPRLLAGLYRVQMSRYPGERQKTFAIWCKNLPLANNEKKWNWI